MIPLLLLLAQNVLPTVPGAVDPQVTQANIHQTICVKGYTKKVRNVSSGVKAIVYLRGQVTDHRSVEVDHLISLELGGSNDIANLWAEPYEPRPGAHEKDRVENWLHKKVCDGTLSLEEAQKAIATDWPKVYRSIQ
jgi:hypothetical protein